MATNFGPLQPIVDDARGAYKKVNDFFSKVPTPGAGQPSDHDKAIQEMTKKATDKGVQDATKSFATQTAAQKKTAPAPTPGKIITSKAGPRKKM